VVLVGIFVLAPLPRPAKPTSISPVGTDPRWVDAFFLGWGLVVCLGASVYRAYRAWRSRDEYSDDD
jgi:hypothetical protein